MDEECYPAISMNTATNGHGPRKYPHTTNGASGGTTVTGGQPQPASQGPAVVVTPSPAAALATQNRTMHHHTYAAAAGRGRGGTLVDEDGDTNLSDDNDDSDDSSFDSDEMDMDETMIKEEPLSPSSSCPPSPVMHANNTRSKSKMLNNINLSQMAALTNTDLVFEHTVSGHLSLPFFSLLLNLVISPPSERFNAPLTRVPESAQDPPDDDGQGQPPHVQAKHQNGAERQPN